MPLFDQGPDMVTNIRGGEIEPTRNFMGGAEWMAPDKIKNKGTRILHRVLNLFYHFLGINVKNIFYKSIVDKPANFGTMEKALP
ncbi:hypothetical protein [uncultured Thermanaerothrix sp.]|uniref:hypothetical protein n=1 Tax=uncultured Thermanaerothrix sp. TaxID=1195149 RepID=UPI0026270DED|nr:hypothetical protein [uncultured Thermanaerothrix sp.]